MYDESGVRDLAWARRYDIEGNIRDNQATPLEVALYVRGEFSGGVPLTNEEAERAGITREGKLGSIGFRIGRRAGESVMDALRNGRIDDRAALWIADFCPGNDAVQRRGLEAALRDASKAEVLARMEAELAKLQMQDEMGLGGGFDLFGNALDNDEFMDFVARFVVRKRNELAQDASYLNATAKKKNAEAMGRKYGVDVKDPAALKKKLDEINALRERWKNPYSDSELMDEIRAAWRGREGGDAPADAMASRVETPGEKLFREYAAGAWRTEGADFSVGDLKRPMVRVAADETPADKADLVARLKKMAGVKYRNAASGMEASISGDSANKIAFAEKESITNLARLGYTEKDAGHVHRAAAVKIGELFGKSELYFEEPVYHKKDSRERAWHFFEPVEVDVNGTQEAFLSNISVIEYRDAGERIFSLELTIENPVGDREDMAAPLTGRQALHPNGASDVRLAAFDSFVKKERAQIERKAREKGLMPWRVDEARVNELRGEADKIRKDIGALLAKFGGDETKLQQYRRDQKKLHALREALARKQAEIDAESKPAGMPDLDAPLAPNGKPSKLAADDWVTVRTQAFKEWFGDWENDPENASKAVDGNGEPLVAYHGTDADFKAFDIGKAGKSTPYAGVGFWFSDVQGFGKAWAADAPEAAGEPREMAVFLNIKRPKAYRTRPGKHGDAYEQFAADVAAEMGKDADFANSGDEEALMAAFRENPDTAAKYRRRLEEEGYDGIALKGTAYDSVYAGDADGTNDQYIAFRSAQAKSATDNRGTFDGGSARIDFSICGLKAKTANEYLEKGADYRDPADGQRKFVLPTAGARLRSDVTPGMMNVPAGGHKDVSLAALLHYPELFRAYPQLAGMRVRLYRPAEETNMAGYFSPEEGNGQAAYIAVNVAYRSNVLNTLLHESQHAIQQYEGFAMGAANWDQAGALAYIGKAIGQRKEAGTRDDWSRLVERIVPVASDSEDGGPIGRALHFNSVRDAADVLNRLQDDGTYSARPNSIGESWNNNVQTTQRYADGKVNVILRCKKYHSRKRLDGLYPYLNIPKHYEGGTVASEGESIMPGSCRFGNAKLVRQSRNKLGGWDYEFEIEEMED